MKKVIFVVLIAIPFLCNAQEPISYSEVFTTDSVGAEKIYVAINDWFATNYNSSTDVLQMADKDAGIFIGKASYKYNCPLFGFSCADGSIDYTIKVYIKENRFKVELMNFTHRVPSGVPYACDFGLLTVSEEFKAPNGMYQKKYNEVWNDIKNEAKIYSGKLMLSFLDLSKNIKSPTSETSEW